MYVAVEVQNSVVLAARSAFASASASCAFVTRDWARFRLASPSPPPQPESASATAHTAQTARTRTDRRMAASSHRRRAASSSAPYESQRDQAEHSPDGIGDQIVDVDGAV